MVIIAIKGSAVDDVVKNFPAPNTAYNKVLGMLLTFNLNHMDPLSMIIDEYLSMCEAGWEPTIAIFTTVHWSPMLLRYFRRRSYCYRIDRSLDIRIINHDPSIGVALGAEHRKYTGREIFNHDVFIYHEDDIMFKHTHLAAYLNETKKLHELDPKWGLNNNCIGFQRYRHIGFSQGYGVRDIIEQNLLEEMPTFNPICFENGKEPYILVGGNTHQAMWILTKGQILLFQEKCRFLNYSNPSREHMSSFGLFGNCGVTKLIPARQFTSFSILHYYPQRHVSWTPVFTAIENMESGYHYYAVPKTRIDLPSCWSDIKAKMMDDLLLDEIDKNHTLSFGK